MFNPKCSGKMICCMIIALCCAGFTATPSAVPVTKKAMVVFVKFSSPFCSSAENCEPDFKQGLVDTIHSPRHTPATYVNMLNYTMTNFIMEATYNNSRLVFETILNPDSADGWFDAPHQLEDYNQSQNARMGQDALDLAYSVVGDEVQDYDLLFVVNNIQSQYGYSTGLGPYSLVVMGEHFDDESFLEVAGHELGHVHGLQHVIMGPYDIVGNSDVLTHYGGWSKVYAGWATGITDMPCIDGPCEITTVLTPLEHAGNNVLRIPLVDASRNNEPRLPNSALAAHDFLGYFVECRAKSGFDEKIPEAGVVITSVDTYFGLENAAKIVFPTRGSDYSDAALAPGEAYVDDAQGITITYLSKDGLNNCTVKASRGEIDVPDPMIKRGIEEASSAGYIKYGSRDIWIDSPENGWDVYPFGTSFSLEGVHIVPSGYGDPFWVDHENRIKFLVRNHGYSAAENVVVDVYVAQPIMISIPGITCDGPEPNSEELIGTVEIDHLDDGEVYLGEVPWTPTVNASAQVRVVIRDYIGEITHSNNSAGETYAPQFILTEALNAADFTETLEAASSESGSVLVQANTTCPWKIPYKFTRRVISAIDKKDWVMNLDKLQGMALPGEQTQVPLASLPPADAQPGDCVEVMLELTAMKDDVFIPVDGITYRSCVVAPSSLTCSTPQAPLEPESNVEVTGKLSPASEKARIALEYISPEGESFIQNPVVDADGGYTSQFLPEVSGEWQVKAYWQGDDRTAPTESEICKFSVENGTPQFTLNHNINCRSGPGTEYPVVTSGKIGDVIEVEGRSADALWLFGTMKNSKCWMSLELGKLNVHPWSLAEQEAPAPPAKPSKAACSQYTSEAVCLRHKDVCKWVPEATTAGRCTAK